MGCRFLTKNFSDKLCASGTLIRFGGSACSVCSDLYAAEQHKLENRWWRQMCTPRWLVSHPKYYFQGCGSRNFYAYNSNLKTSEVCRGAFNAAFVKLSRFRRICFKLRFLYLNIIQNFENCRVVTFRFSLSSTPN